MSKAYLILGGNCGDVLNNINKAKVHIEQKVGRIICRSSLYKTEPWGFEANTDFLNQVVEVETDLTPQRTLNELLKIELIFGRERRSGGYESRTMDIDILLFDDRTMKDTNLQIPHPRMHLRNFTLVPLAEIAGDLIHPILKKDIETLKSNCRDTQKVEKLVGHLKDS